MNNNMNKKMKRELQITEMVNSVPETERITEKRNLERYPSHRINKFYEDWKKQREFRL